MSTAGRSLNQTVVNGKANREVLRDVERRWSGHLTSTQKRLLEQNKERWQKFKRDQIRRKRIHVAKRAGVVILGIALLVIGAVFL